MNAFVARLTIVGLALAAASTPAAAQLQANPVYFSPKAPTGLTLAADFGTMLSTKVDGVKLQGINPNNVGLRAELGLPIATVGAAVGLYDSDVPSADKDVQFAGTLAVKLFSPPLIPVGISLQAGAGYLSQTGGSVLDIPIGLGIAVKPPTPNVSFEAWAAPRVQFRRVSGTGASATQAGVGASAGVNIGMPMGVGVHAALDWSRLAAKTSGTFNLQKLEGLVLGIGLHYTFTIPGLPVPVI